MATGTLTQIGPSLGPGIPPIEGTIPMHDLAGVLTATGIFVEITGNPPWVCKFQQWGPSSAIVDSLTTSGNWNGFPTHFQMAFHGTGNLTGKGNDDTYSGTLSCDLSYEYNEVLHKYMPVFKNGSASITYTD